MKDLLIRSDPIHGSLILINLLVGNDIDISKILIEFRLS